MKKKVTTTIVLVFFAIQFKAQNKEVFLNKTSFNIQIGTVGVWLNNEVRLDEEVAFRAEIGLYTETIKGIGFYMAPEITLEPRWYYNVKKRAKNNLNITNNSANFFTVKTSFKSNIFEISNFNNKRAENSISIIPKWGIRRFISKKINYELGLGVGYLKFINQKYKTLSDSDGIHIDFHARLSYSF